MTIQTAEKLICNDREFRMDSQPLEIFFRLGGNRLPFLIRSTACWRGYVGTWRLDDARLKFVGLNGFIARKPLEAIAARAFEHKIDIDDPTLCSRATIEDVFPGFPGPVLAHWYSGRIQAVDAKDRSVELVANIRRGIALDVTLVTAEGQP